MNFVLFFYIIIFMIFSFQVLLIILNYIYKHGLLQIYIFKETTPAKKVVVKYKRF